MIFKRKKTQLKQSCVFATQDEQCTELSIDNDTLLCKHHHDEAIKSWPIEMLQQHKKMIKDWKDQQDFDLQRQSIPAQKFEKKMVDLLVEQENSRQEIKKKYHITDQYFEIFIKRYQGK